MQANEIPIPKLWPQMIRKAMIHAISLAYSAIACSRAKAIDSWDPSIRLKGKLDQAENEISLLREQMRMICKRFNKIPSHKRPYYGPDDRLEILMIKAMRGWNNRQTAQEFMIDEATVANWLKHLDCDDTTLFKQNPKSEDLTDVLDNALKRSDCRPKYITSDKGTQFFPSNPNADRKYHNYHQWCKRNGIKPRFGAVGKHGSIAIIERFILSMKTECFYKLPIVPIQESAVRKELALYITWYNCYRPHQTLDARTPEEVYSNSPPEIKQYDMPNSKLPELELYISYLEGRKHLPVIEINEKAA